MAGECNREGKPVGMKCAFCMNHGKSPRNGKGNWMDVPCYSQRRDEVKKHAGSPMYKTAQHRIS